MFGLPTVFLMFQNGLVIGVMTALYTGRALFVDFSGWLLIHGVVELTAIILCGGAGLYIGHHLVFPGRRSRLSELRRAGRLAAQIAVGAVFLFFCAGILEGFGRQTIIDTNARLIIALVSAAALALYFFWPRQRT